jgi:hypothetical protein
MADKKKIKEAITKLKEAKKELGRHKITGVSDPGKVDPKKKRKEAEDDKGKKRKKQMAATGTGPRGGSFTVSASGKKIYESSKRDEDVHKSIEEYFEEIEKIDAFINQFKEFKGLM